MSALRHNVDRYLVNTGNLPYGLLNAFGLREAMIRWLDRNVTSPRRLVFAISPGRSGSAYLARLLDATANASAAHEPRPRINGGFLRGLDEARLAATYDRRRVKIVQLLRALRPLPGDHTYVETSHMFVKTFYDVVLDFFDDVRIVHLRRDTAEVIRSFVELGYLSPASTHWRHWMHDPYDAQPLVPPAVDEAEADSVDRIIAYLVDIEARAERLCERYPDTPVISVCLESISDPDRARTLVERLGLKWTDAAAAACRQRANVRSDRKQLIDRSVELEYCRERLDRYLSRARQRSIALPGHMGGR